MATQTSTKTLTIQERFNLALDGLRSKGITVLLNQKGGVTYGSDARIAWTGVNPALTFDKEGNPIAAADTGRTGWVAGDRLDSISISYAGGSSVVEDIYEQFALQGFVLESCGTFIDINF